MFYRQIKKNSGMAVKAFSLLEIMIVIVIIGMLAGVVTVSVRGYLVKAKQNTARHEIATIVQALESFYTAHDRYPTNEEGIEILVEPSDEFPDGLLTKVPVDPWSGDYQYNAPGANGPYEVISYGADGSEGGEGADSDISSDDVKKSEK
jgi:general secretion pathway protein G